MGEGPYSVVPVIGLVGSGFISRYQLQPSVNCYGVYKVITFFFVSLTKNLTHCPR